MNRASEPLDERTTSRRRGAELDVSLDGVPRGRQGHALADALRRRIAAGTLRPGAHLPSSRQLSRDLGVSRGVVVGVYDQLVAEGHLTTAQGSGTSVAAGARGTADEHGSPIDVAAVAGMNPGQPDPSLFPRGEWQRATHQALNTLTDAAFAYGEPRGYAPLRSALVGYLGRTRSIDTDVDRIVVTNGFAQTLHLLVQTLRRRTGRCVIAVEDPGSSGASAQLRWLGAQVVPVPVDDDGLDVAALGRTAAQAVVVTPAHQYPTGVVLAPQRRHELVHWAAATGGIIVEDDYDAEYRYDRAPLTSLHALGPQHVIAAGSVSKCLSPALRLGWAVVPDHLVPDVAAAKANTDLGTCVVTQAALAVFVDNGGLDRHIRRTRTRYRRRRDLLVDALRDVPDLRVSGIAAGLHVLLEPSAHADVEALVEVAAAHGFVAKPLDRYRHRPGAPGIVLGYGTIADHAIGAAGSALAAALSP